MGVLRRAQSALEYLFMVAVALILVAITLRVILSSVRSINGVISNYTATIREEIIQNL
ncbi:class III signal peptide-containing protein [Thermococcus sp. SY098]|uniref:class III signal peptide-containing protein n=1 Tax=Thermococcus TaxID=2263 RepID=UPI001ED95BB7|nr:MULTISPECIES: class III signal peptide-containing protein [Thermococcus]WRS53334.1 class III signal peptide-containing protein [Thermococcus sp. SY098]